MSLAPAHQIVDAAAGERVLVYGSLPPGGRDLDLLVRAPATRAIAEALTSAGFLSHGHEWVRFAGCSVDPVDLTPAKRWKLPAAELEELYGAALALPGMRCLARPAPAHAVLILARRVAGDGGHLAAKHRARLDSALEEDPEAWERATRVAAAWGAERALAQLRATCSGAPRPGLPARMAAEIERRRVAGDGSLRATASALAGTHARVPRGPVIALSGLDGAGKSSQARALAATLERLGYGTTTAWTRMAYNENIWRVVEPLKALLLRLAELRPRPADPGVLGPTGAPAGGHEGSAVGPGADSPSGPQAAAEDPVRRLRERSGLLANAWAAVIAIDNVIAQRRVTREGVRRGDVVICDRYTLDSIVALRYFYGEQRRFALQRALILRLSPRPLRGYFLDVSPETAFARKGEFREQLDRQAVLYRQEHAVLGFERLDGERAREELCAQIARDAWQTLRRPTGRDRLIAWVKRRWPGGSAPA